MSLKRSFLFLSIFLIVILVLIKLFRHDPEAGNAHRRLAELGVKTNSASLLRYAGKDAVLVRLLLEAGVNPNAKTPQVDRTSALIVAALKGNLKSVQLLVKAGADVNYETQFGNSEDITALAAVTLGATARLCEDREKWKVELSDRTQIVLLLLRAGAEPNVPQRYHNVPIIDASCGGMNDAVRELISRGADVNRASKTGKTALIAASGSGYVDTAEILLKAGAKINNMNDYNWTALMIAATLGNKEVVELLLKHGANTEIRNSKGQDALDLAKAKGHEKIVEFLGH